MEKIVLFGAGKIGRSFIGQLFNRSGFEVVFVDSNKLLVDELNQKNEYQVIIKSDRDEILNIKGVRAVSASNKTQVFKEISTARIAAVSTGVKGHPSIFELLAGGLLERNKEYPGLPLDIIIAENLRNSDQYFSRGMKNHLPEDYDFDSLVGLIETSIGKMVPIMTQQQLLVDPLRVFAEPYNTLILDKKGFKNSIPKVMGLAPKENIKAWVDSKMFIHNLGHAAAAYIGFVKHPEIKYLNEVLEIKAILDDVRSVMEQSAAILLRMYPNDFTKVFLTDYINDLLLRFRNETLGDTVFRVGTGLMRKLGPEDRLVAPIKAAMHYHLPFEHLLYTLLCAFRFAARDEKGNMNPEDEVFSEIYQQGIDAVMKQVCGFNPEIHKKLYSLAEKREVL